MAGFYPVKHWMAGYNLMLWDIIKSRCGGEGGIFYRKIQFQTPKQFSPITYFNHYIIL